MVIRRALAALALSSITVTSSFPRCVMIGSTNVGLFARDNDGTPLAFYLAKIDSRPQIEKLLVERGGVVLSRPFPTQRGQRVVCVVSDATDEMQIVLPRQPVIVRRQYVLDCIERSALLPLADYAPLQGVIVATEETSERGRNAFTADEERLLIAAVKQSAVIGYLDDGMRLYNCIAPQFPRHTPQALREHYLRVLKPRAQARIAALSSPIRSSPRPVGVTPALDIFSDPVHLVSGAHGGSKLSFEQRLDEVKDVSVAGNDADMTCPNDIIAVEGTPQKYEGGIEEPVETVESTGNYYCFIEY